ncbi:MAG: hypothetical protein ACI9FU_002042 [Granulosicoccus sp.]|jgi:hypothetical protein
MKKSIVFGVILCVVAAFYSCGSGNEKGDSDYEGTSNDHQITPEESAEFNALGKAILDTAKNMLKTSLMSALQENGPIEAVKFCNVHATGLVDDLAARHGVKINRISTNNRVPANIPDGGGFNVLQRFDNGRMNGNMSSSTLLALHTGQSKYYEPILVDAPCLTCHGMKDEMMPELVTVMDSLYPKDKATGLKLGDLRGAWVVDFQNGDG